MSYFKHVAAAILAISAVSAAQAGATYTNTPNGGGVAPLGVPNTTTYGEVFTAPVDGNTRLDSFSFFISGTLAQAYAGVASWTGNGAGSALFTSSAFNASFNDYTEVTINTGGLDLISGQQYVAYFSAAGIFGNNGTDNMEAGSGSALNVGAAWDNAGGGSPNHNNWAGCQGCRGLDFAGTMTFSEPVAASNVPEPGSFALLGLGIAGLIGVRRRKPA